MFFLANCLESQLFALINLNFAARTKFSNNCQCGCLGTNTRFFHQAKFNSRNTLTNPTIHNETKSKMVQFGVKNDNFAKIHKFSWTNKPSFASDQDHCSSTNTNANNTIYAPINPNRAAMNRRNLIPTPKPTHFSTNENPTKHKITIKIKITQIIVKHNISRIPQINIHKYLE